jgi:hypothetical protein
VKLREKGVEKKITVQRICEMSRNEKKVGEMLDKLWVSPRQIEKELDALLERNTDVFGFERKLVVVA